MLIRPATEADHEAIWRIISPAIAAGETYALPRDMSRGEALAYWTAPDQQVFVAEQDRPESSAPISCARTRPGTGRMSPIAATLLQATRPGAGWDGGWVSTQSSRRGLAAFSPCSSIS